MHGSWGDRGLVVPNTLGGPMDYTNLMPRNFKPLLRRAGLPDIRSHDLRHTWPPCYSQEASTRR